MAVTLCGLVQFGEIGSQIEAIHVQHDFDPAGQFSHTQDVFAIELGDNVGGFIDILALNKQDLGDGIDNHADVTGTLTVTVLHQHDAGSVTVGVQSSIPSFDLRFTTGLALIATPAEKSTIKVLYGSAFRAPNAYELYYAFDTQSANPDLKPEKITTTEVVDDQYLGDHVRASLSGYYYQIDDLIHYGDDSAIPGNTQFQNIDEVTAQGAEAELEGKWANGLEGRISYTVQRTKDKTTGEPLTNSPGQMGKAALNVPLMKQKLFLGIEEQYMGRRMTDGGAFAPAFYITNMTLFSQNMFHGSRRR